MAESPPASGVPRFALQVYFVLACAVLVGLVLIWPKYQARRSLLQSNYEGRVKGHEYRVREHAEAVEEARRAGRDETLPSAVTWPVIIAGASVAIPCLALVFALATGRKPAERTPGPPSADSSAPPAAGDPSH